MTSTILTSFEGEKQELSMTNKIIQHIEGE